MLGSHTDIDGKKQYEQAIQRQNAYLAALHETALGILGRLDIDELLVSIVERAVSLIDATDGIFDLVDTERDELEVKYGTGIFRNYAGTYVKRGEGVSGKAWESGQQIVVEDYNTWEGRSSQFEGMPMGPAIGVPLKSGKKVIGTFGILRPPGSPAFDPEEIDLIGRFAQLASIALDNARLHTSLQAELAERKHMDEIVQNRLFFEKIVSDSSTQFINLGPNEVDAGIQHALGTIGRFVGADRSYVFILSEDGKRMTNTHEWCAQGIQPMQERIQDQRVDVAPWCLGQVKALEVVNVPSVADLPLNTVPDRVEWEQQNIQSLLVVPMVYQVAAIGFLGLDAVRSPRTWSDENIALLHYG
jgi:GAF domain-containing protein